MRVLHLPIKCLILAHGYHFLVIQQFRTLWTRHLVVSFVQDLGVDMLFEAVAANVAYVAMVRDAVGRRELVCSKVPVTDGAEVLGVLAVGQALVGHDGPGKRSVGKT